MTSKIDVVQGTPAKAADCPGVSDRGTDLGKVDAEPVGIGHTAVRETTEVRLPDA